VRTLTRIGDCARRLGASLATEPRIVAELTFWRWSLPVLKRLLPIETLASLMTPRVTAAPSATQRRERTAAVLRVVTTGGRLLVSSNCLERSLVTFRLLARAGADVRLVLGVRRDDSTLDGHSWIELDGRSLDTPKSDDYTPMVSFRTHGRLDGIERVAADALPPS
jgi:transglutaminase superfamily protein